MSFFQKVGNWLADREGNARGAAEWDEGGNPSAPETARTPLDPFGNGNDEYGGRVPYRGKADTEEIPEEPARRRGKSGGGLQQYFRQPQQQLPVQQMPQQPAPQQEWPQNAVPPQPAAEPQHVEYVVLLRSRNECKDVIAYIKSNASVFLNMEFIPSDAERQRCVDMLSGAAYTLECAMNKISPRGIYLISAPGVKVVLDPALSRVSSAEKTAPRAAEDRAAMLARQQMRNVFARQPLEEAPMTAQPQEAPANAAPEYSAPKQQPARVEMPTPPFAPGTPTMRFRAQELQGAPGSFGRVMTEAPQNYSRFQNGQ